MIIAECLADKPYNLNKDLVDVQNRSNALTDLGDHLRLFRLPLNGVKETSAFYSHTDLVADGNQNGHVLLAKLPNTARHDKERAQHLPFGAQRHTDQRAVSLVAHGQTSESRICGHISHDQRLA